MRLPVLESTVDAGHRAVIFDRFRGVQDSVVGEGTHFLIPWVQKPIIFDCRSRPRNVPVITGSKGTRVTCAAAVMLSSLCVFMKIHLASLKYIISFEKNNLALANILI